MPGKHRSGLTKAPQLCLALLTLRGVELKTAGLAAGDAGVTSLWLLQSDDGEGQGAEVGFPDSAGNCPSLS